MGDAREAANRTKWLYNVSARLEALNRLDSTFSSLHMYHYRTLRLSNFIVASTGVPLRLAKS